MSYETRAQLVARLVKIDAALDAARNGSYTIGGRSSQRGSIIESLRKEREECVEKIESYDRFSTGGFANKVKFERPA